jgi:hypothetical protein
LIGSGTIDIEDNVLYNLPTRYIQNLMEFTEKVDSELNVQVISEDEKDSINSDIEEFAKAVEGSKLELDKENELPRAKKREFLITIANNEFGLENTSDRN